jgi:hypothetical protein
MAQQESQRAATGGESTVPPAAVRLETLFPSPCGGPLGDRSGPEDRATASAPLPPPPPPPPPPPAATRPTTYHIPRNRNAPGPFYVVLEGKDVGIWQTWCVLAALFGFLLS